MLTHHTSASDLTASLFNTSVAIATNHTDILPYLKPPPSFNSVIIYFYFFTFARVTSHKLSSCSRFTVLNNSCLSRTTCCHGEVDVFDNKKKNAASLHFSILEVSMKCHDESLFLTRPEQRDLVRHPSGRADVVPRL